MVLLVLYDIEKSYVIAGMFEMAFFPVIRYLSPSSAFRHQGSVRFRYHWSRISPAFPSYGDLFFEFEQFKTGLHISIYRTII